MITNKTPAKSAFKAILTLSSPRVAPIADWEATLSSIGSELVFKTTARDWASS